MQVESSQNELPERFDEAEPEQSNEQKSAQLWTDVDRPTDDRLQQVVYKRSDRVRRVEGRVSLQDLALGKSGLGRSGLGRSGLGKLGQGKSGQGKSGQGGSGQGGSGQGGSGQGRPASSRLAPVQSTNPRRAAKQAEPMTQSLVLLASMALVLVAARFAVPRIVEEIRYGWHRGELRAEYESGVQGIRSVSLEALSDASQMVTSVVGPSVVHIDVQRRAELGELGGNEVLSRNLPTTDQGSGVLVAEDGYVLTNRHVIAGGEDITVKLSDGRRVPAMVVGTDALTDLAVLKVDADRLISIGWGDSDRCKVGSPVWAVGSPFGLDRTVTFGILSGKHRMVRASTQYQDFMQSDVAVNPGNSGGPLVDASGTLVGINTAIVGDTYQGVSFSIPSNVAREVYERIRKTGRVDRAWLGVQLGEVSEADHLASDQQISGAYVAAVTSLDSPAAIAGLKAGDRIHSIDGTEARDMGHLMRLIGGSMAGRVVILGVERAGASMEIEVTLGSRPDAFNR